MPILVDGDITATFDVVDVAPPTPSICRASDPWEPMAASRGPTQAFSEAGKSWRCMKRPLEVPARIRTAGKLRRTLFGALSYAIGKSGMRTGDMCGTVESFAFWVIGDLESERSIYAGRTQREE